MSSTIQAHTGAAALMGKPRSGKSMRFGVWYVAEHRLRAMKAYLGAIITGSFFNPLIYLFALGIGIGSYIDANAAGAATGVAGAAGTAAAGAGTAGAGAAAGAAMAAAGAAVAGAAGSGAGLLGGVSYLVFVGPALLASAALTVAFEETSYVVMGGFRWSREFWSMNAAPIRAGQIADGVLLAAAFRIVFTVVVFWVLLLVFGAAPSPFAALAMPAAILASLAFGAVIMAVACRIEEDDSWFSIIYRLVIAPMLLFSGTFFPLEGYPVWLRWIGWISPLWHGTQLGRVAAWGMAEPLWLTAAHLAYLLAMLAVGRHLAHTGFARRLSK